MSTKIVEHSLVQHYLTLIRKKETRPAEFRMAAKRITEILGVEATRGLAVESCRIETPLCETQGSRLSETIGLVPILRAGLGMLDPMLELLPDAETWHLGFYRDEETATPVEYYNKLPPGRPVDLAFLLDPMLATGGSAIAAIEALKEWGVKKIIQLSLIAAPEGIDAINQAAPDVDIYVGVVDECLNEQKFIVPGLGDAGDRIFAT